MAARLGVDHQGLLQFISSSTGDYEGGTAQRGPVGVQAIEPAAYVIDDTGFPKDGTASPCVARQTPARWARPATASHSQGDARKRHEHPAAILAQKWLS